MDIPPELIAAKALAEPVLMAMPGVVGIGLGMREEDGEFVDELAVVVMVEDLSTVPEGLPEEIGSVAVCVVERRIEPLASDTARYSELKGGIEITQPLSGHGTMGAIVEDASSGGSGELLGLTCQHVAGPAGQHFPDSVWQPDNPPLPVGVTPPRTDHLGEVIRVDFPQTPPLPFSPVLVGMTDSAVFKLDNLSAVGRTLTAAVAGQGSQQPPNLVDSITDTADPQVTQSVRKRGFVTRVTLGTVIRTNVTMRWAPGGSSTWLVDQFEILRDPLSPAPEFALSGDSGSVVLDASSETALGLLWAGTLAGDFVAAGAFGYGSPITRVEAALEISMVWA